MTKRFVTASGAVVQLGRELGKGGEGSVFEVPSLPNQVAKLYHDSLDRPKQDKLRFMVTRGDQALLQYSAWPQDTLHPSSGGPVAGFLMPKVTGRDPIHMLYGPAYRRQNRPKAAWDFLLYAARNTAVAFEALHARGHVLGDVNQGNVFVGADSKVVLIDCDSFQINANGTLHLCEVGVAHFTPPELQGLSSFRGVKRSANHDNFGLALLIFHLLFGGRHPFSGVPQKSEAGEALESDIKAFRYAYARDSKARGMLPPPKSIPIALVPDSMQAMFEQAFTERGTSGLRPTAQQWVAAIDALRTRMKKCSSASIHVYPDHLTHCPWCALEQQGIVYFVDLGTTITATASGFVLTKVWALIEAIAPPPPVSMPNVASITVTATPLPVGLKGNGHPGLLKALIVIVALCLTAAIPAAWIIWGGAAYFAWSAVGGSDSPELAGEKLKRKNRMITAERAYQALADRARKEAGPEGFNHRKKQLSDLRNEYVGLAAKEKVELDKLHQTAEQRQRDKFLDRYFIEVASIPGVGPAKKAALRSFGIETAADVQWNKVRSVKGFGEVLTRAVVDWRKACERKFVFNPAQAVTEADRNAVRAKLMVQRKGLEASLLAGVTELQRMSTEVNGRTAALRNQLQAAAQEFAQARADLAGLS
ncbi:helix-hairpin-helix domain-containing protein [Massilia phyllosphaerae]|uniref:helix-hairpin-helix domain-containing protein n=1 Tax=Massilia phyllosphaerae TaxID=3106034 RepID=UPI002B1CC960|nr:helix-hairpin-helix domain-containing protein [Massilia sp. SGZ-792]